MSINNGVYILQTYGPEFRVAYAHAIDNIFGKFDNETLHWEGDPDMMLQYFGESKVFTDMEDAMDEAERLSVGHEWLEDGICVISEFSHIKLGDKNG